jgi:XTP/dITP diphosphohydrolase
MKMKKKDKIIFATTNEGKMKEIRLILKDLDYDIQSMKEAGIDIDIVEDGKTFEENAVIKAKAIMEMTGAMVLADDSGLEVDAMDKAPGIYSARFLGENTSYDIKNNYILDKLKTLPWEERSARFVCAIACALPGGEILTTRATVEGFIGYEIKGENGFGYDPIFWVPEYSCTSAELTTEIKNKISHRGKALEEMKAVLRNRLL